MSLLTPIGLLGLIGLIILIIIYIIKPNYQNKFISSTYVWQLSLKFQKKKIPLSNIRNILIFICQVLAIASCALILTQPFIQAEKEETVKEKIVIIDASASMLTKTDGVTRFERAIDEVRTLAEEIFENDGRITVILASKKASIIAAGVTSDSSDLVYEALDSLVDPTEERVECSYGASDINGAIKLAEETTSINPETEVLLYTDTNYIDSGRVVIKDIKLPDEWNASILDVRAKIYDNYYRFEIDVACYGSVDADVDVYLDVYGTNDDKMPVNLSGTARCIGGEITTLVFSHVPDDKTIEELGYTQAASIFSYDYATARIEESDSFEEDNVFELYGGEKPSLRIQYASSSPNNFFASAIMVLRDTLGKRWNVEFVELKANEQPEMSGFDFYIFEHKIPDALPTDGVVLLANPDFVPAITGLKLGKSYSVNAGHEVFLKAGDEHPLMRGVSAESITVSQFTEIANADGYTPLMYVDDMPVVMAKNEPDQKIVAMTFSLNYSNLSMLLSFPMLMYNMFQYYIPSTLTEFVFDVNDELSLNSRSDELLVEDELENKTELTEFPGVITLTTPGTYKVTYTPISGNEVTEYFFVKIPESECDIAPIEDTLQPPYFATYQDSADFDLLIYFALALVALLFVEWWLQSREQF